jgi:hypothetical protein
MSPRTRDGIERRIVVGLAGGEAERVVSKRYNRTGASSDLRNAVTLLIHLVGSSEEASAFFKVLQIRARNLVAAPHRRPALDAVAADLLERTTLSGIEIGEVIRDAYRSAMNFGWAGSSRSTR